MQVNRKEECKQIVLHMQAIADVKRIEKKAYFGIDTNNMLGLTNPQIREIAKHIHKNTELAKLLWQTGIHEARLLASIVADEKNFTLNDVDLWVSEFNSWDICDGCCSNLFCKIPNITEKIHFYASANGEYQKRFSFAMIAVAAVHWKKEHNNVFIAFFPLLEKESSDNRNFVKKAINWAIRQIGKRNLALNERSIEFCEQLLSKESKSAKWIANHALLEIKSVAVQNRLIKK